MGKKKKYKGIMTIGTDPEFLLVDEKNFRVNAGRIPFFSSTHDNSKIGCDGSGDPVEIRPNPTPINKIDIMLKDINISIKRIARYCYFNKLTLRAGANKDGRCIGGHIHFGSKVLQYSGRINYHDGYVQHHVPEKILFHRERLIDCLDTFFMPIINLLIPEREILDRLKDEHGTYGVLHQYRPQDWGIEYRTPWSFLVSPFLTKASFSLACLIANNYTKFVPTKETIKLNHDFYKNLSRMGNYRRGRKLYKIIKPIILKMMKYRSPNPHNDSSIISLFNLIERGKKVITLDVLCNYGLKKPPIPEFTLFYAGNEYMRYIKNILANKIENKNFGEIYLYDINNYGENKKIIYLSAGMPKITTPKDVEVVYETQKKHRIIKNSIGFSRYLINHGIDRARNINYLIKYLNNLKLKIEDDDVNQ